MSEDETVVMIVCIGVGLFTWGSWYRLFLTTVVRRSRASLRPLLALVPPACLAGLFVMLKFTASGDVRDSAVYLAFYVLFGAAWLGAGIRLLQVIGVEARDDAFERDNPAAIVAVCAGLAGLTACYAGANVGDGPGWWCVLFAGGLALVAWVVLLAVYQAVCDAAEAITVERDINSALRFGGFAVGAGILCGRGAAGDWTSAARTVVEFGDAWPALVLLAIACVLERLVFTTGPNDEASGEAGSISMASILCALLYAGGSVCAILFLLPPPANSIGPL